MSTEFHPDLRRIARITPRRLVGRRSLPLLRVASALHGRRAGSDVTVLTPAAGVTVRVHRPPRLTGAAPALLWIHGGGYVIGSAAQDDRLCRRFSRALGITVAAVDYRLAPEHRYPAALEDCYSALTWLSGLPGVDPARVAIGGASAGGGLTAALALLARDRGGPAPVLQLLVYPMLDDRSGESADDPRYRLWDPRSNRFGWTCYLGDADPRVAVPARRTDLDGLAPAWLGIGTLDLFYEEGLAYAERLRRAGVPCQVETVPGAFHGFDLLASTAPVSRAFFAAQCTQLRTAFAQKG